MLVQYFVRVGLVGIVVLSENEMGEPLVFIYYRQGIELVVPENVVGLA